MAKKTKKKKIKSDSSSASVYVKLGKRIRELRKERGYTSALKFAFDNDLSHVQMSRWEQGTNMNLDSLVKLSRALGVTVSDLLKDY